MNNPITTNGEASYPLIDIDELKRKGSTFRENEGASVIDIGDKVALVEFHTKANSLTDDVVEMFQLQ